MLQRNADQFCWRKYQQINREIEQSMKVMLQVSQVEIYDSLVGGNAQTSEC